MDKGLHHKYNVTKVEGPTDPNANYFVLRLDTDRHAREAAKYYAALVADENVHLAGDLLAQIKLLEISMEQGTVGPMTLNGLEEDLS